MFMQKVQVNDPSEQIDQNMFSQYDQNVSDISSRKLHEPNILNFNEKISSSYQKIIYLNFSKTSYIKISCLPEDLRRYAIDNFSEMFDLHPTERHNIILRMKQVEVYRWQQSYLNTPPHYDEEVLRRKSYMFSGFDASNNNIELPDHFKNYYEYIKSQDNRYNQVVANWYKTGDDYIAYHSDCEIDMVPNAEITTISLYEKDNDNENKYRLSEPYGKKYRTISFVPKDGVDSVYDRVNIVAYHGLVITMCGDTQAKFRHGIEKTETDVLPRISLSFRQYQ
jgi:alkylated DNA repair dioxygenase AlkB